MNDLSLDVLRVRERNLEEEWISKYRAALLATPSHETWENRLHKFAYKVYGSAAAIAHDTKAKILSNRVSVRSMQIVPPAWRTRINPHPRFPVVSPLPAIAPRKTHPVGVSTQNAKKAG